MEDAPDQIYHVMVSSRTETPFTPLCSSEQLQLQRLRSRNDLTVAEAQARINAQESLASKLIYADYVIDNSGPLPDLTSQVSRVATKLEEKAGWSWVISWLIPPIGLIRGIFLVGWRLYIKGVGKEKERRKSRGEKKAKEEEFEMKVRRNTSRMSGGGGSNRS